MELMLDCLFIAKVIERTTKPSHNTVSIVYKDGQLRYYKWTGGKTVVVQVGDQVDRCRRYDDPNTGDTVQCDEPRATYDDESSDEKILVFMSDLDRLARKYNGAVYSLLGNHELMNTIGNMNYVSYLGLKEYSKTDKVDAKGRTEYFKRGSDISRFIACTRPAVMIIGSYMFVHAGFLEHVVKIFSGMNRTETLDNLNMIYNAWIINEKHKIKNIDNPSNFVLSTTSPLLARGVGALPTGLSKEDLKCEPFNYVLDFFAIKGMVVGHTPQLKTGINSTCGNSLFRVDVASSRAFNKLFPHQNGNDTDDHNYEVQKSRRPQVLEILRDKEMYVLDKDSRTKLT
jgi:hypothetical protein